MLNQFQIIFGLIPDPYSYYTASGWLAAAAIIAAAAGVYAARQQRHAIRDANNANAAQQDAFAKHGVQWKVQDARRAGIAPEYALGASTISPSPTHTPDTSSSMIADAGQNISRAALASATQPDRDMTKALQAETLRGMKLDNQIKETQGLSQTGFPQNPAFPHPNGNVIPGQGNSPVKDVQLERTGMSRSSPYSEGGSIPSVGWAKTADGGLRPVPSTDIKNRIEDQIIPETAWAAQHLMAPNVGKGPKPPEDALPKGASDWRWSVSRQAWYPYSSKISDAEAQLYKNRFNRKYKEGYENPYEQMTY